MLADRADPAGNRGDYFRQATVSVRRVADDGALAVTEVASDPPGVNNFLNWRVPGWEVDTLYQVAIRGVTLQDGRPRDYTCFVFVEREALVP